MTILFFSQAREAAGCESWVMEVGGSLSIDDFWALLLQRFPGLAPLKKGLRLARNQCYLLPEERLEPGDEVALIPPVSGG